MKDFIDLHTHTILSDGNFQTEEMIKMAAAEGIGHLAITDHNKIHTDIDRLRGLFPEMEIISASEVSSRYETAAGEIKEIHIVGLFLEQTEELKSFLAVNNDDNRERMTKMLEKLNSIGVELGCRSYDELHDRYFPERNFIGRPQLSQLIVDKGFADDADQAMDRYIGDYGDRLAYVPNEHIFAGTDRVIAEIHKAFGVAVLAHPYSYNLKEDEIISLIEHFRSLGGDGMEVLYGKYDDDKRAKLRDLADRYGLLPSCGSDFHGKRKNDRLDHHFPPEYLEQLRAKHEEYLK